MPQDFREGDETGDNPLELVCHLDHVVSERPMLAPLALAFLDDAFEHLKEPNDLLRLRTLKGEEMLSLTINQELLEAPVFRSGHVGEATCDRILDAGRSSKCLRGIGLACGHERSFQPYCTRHDICNKLQHEGPKRG